MFQSTFWVDGLVRWFGVCWLLWDKSRAADCYFDWHGRLLEVGGYSVCSQCSKRSDGSKHSIWLGAIWCLFHRSNAGETCHMLCFNGRSESATDLLWFLWICWYLWKWFCIWSCTVWVTTKYWDYWRPICCALPLESGLKGKLLNFGRVSWQG